MNIENAAEINAEPLTRAQFELRVAQIQSHAAIAFRAAKTLDAVNASAREIALQRMMNRMVEDLVTQLEIETNITVAVTRCDERAMSIPFPISIKYDQTMRNFDKRI